MMWREDCSYAGHDDVELVVVERNRLGVRLRPVEPHSTRACLAATGVQQLGRKVRRDNLRAGLGGRDRRVA